MDTADFKKVFRNIKLKKYMALIFACGILLMAFSDKVQKPPESVSAEAVRKDTEESVSSSYNNSMEKRLEEFLEKIDGAGEVKVMVTYKSGPEKVIATETKSMEDSDEESAANGVSRVSRSISSEVNMAYSGSEISKGEPFIVKENTPEAEGIVVIAQGGGNIEVKEAITRAAQALFDVPAHKVEVLKMGV